MTIKLERVMQDEKEILRNLLEKYDYEFSQYDERRVNRLGLFGYGYLDHYWSEENRWAYFIMADGELAGFVMVNNHPEVADHPTDFSLAEFFVMYPFRRAGVGRQAFFQALALHRGTWQLKLHPKNAASVNFWHRVVNEYTKGDFQLIKSAPGTEYADGSPGDVYFFQS